MSIDTNIDNKYGERIFQETCRILAAQLQVVTYKEWLPIVLGPDLMKHDLNILSTGFTQYDPTRDPTITDSTLDSTIRGLIATPISAWGPGVDEDVRNHLYQTHNDRFGGYLVAINIKRGRDRAIPSYTSSVKHCYSKDIIDWSQLDEYMKPIQRS
ncbi:myeloperoxidase-like [Panonychus citri]|uniref:myeloperoxidase-like n=1 Tax=Panonychus citri TaxID=50023 RepID=UPI0023075BFE|nr:myeloperoxidase-like [Panonychus citri]